MENRPAARRGSVQGSPKLKAVLSVYWAIFHAGTLISEPTVVALPAASSPGWRGAAWGGARLQCPCRAILVCYMPLANYSVADSEPPRYRRCLHNYCEILHSRSAKKQPFTK